MGPRRAAGARLPHGPLARCRRAFCASRPRRASRGSSCSVHDSSPLPLSALSQRRHEALVACQRSGEAGCWPHTGSNHARFLCNAGPRGPRSPRAAVHSKEVRREHSPAAAQARGCTPRRLLAAALRTTGGLIRGHNTGANAARDLGGRTRTCDGGLVVRPLLPLRRQPSRPRCGHRAGHQACAARAGSRSRPQLRSRAVATSCARPAFF